MVHAGLISAEKEDNQSQRMCWDPRNFVGNYSDTDTYMKKNVLDVQACTIYTRRIRRCSEFMLILRISWAKSS